MILRGYDIDGVLSKGIVPISPYVIISGRTISEYDDMCKALAMGAPVFIRGAGQFGDGVHAGNFKAMMINHLGVKMFYEDDPLQISIIKKQCPECEIIKI